MARGEMPAFTQPSNTNLANDETGSFDDEIDWMTRSSRWSMQARRKNKRSAKRQRANAVVLGGHGVSLKIDAGTLLIRNGYTHFPQKQQ
jgi:hypothetical protein